MSTPDAGPPGSLAIRVVRDAGALEALGPAWRVLLDRAGGTVFQTHEWQSTWWRHFGGRASLRVLTAWRGAELVGAAPFVLEPVTAAGIPLLRRMRLLGTEQSDYLDILMRPDVRSEVAVAMAGSLIQSAEWDAIELEDIPEGAPSASALIEALAAARCRVRGTFHRWCFAIPLPASLEDYLSRLHPHRRKELRRRSRRLEEQGGQFHRLSADAPAAAAWDEFCALHTRQWVRRGRPSALADPNTQAFQREVTEIFHRRGWLHLTFLRRDGACIAAEYAFHYGPKTYAYLSAMDLQSGWARWSPGLVLNLKCIEYAVDDGLVEYDLMRGKERYKTTLRAVGRANRRYEIVAPRPTAALRATARRVVRTAARWRTVAVRKAAAGLARS